MTTPNQFTILEALQHGARWKRSFQMVKPLLDDLIAKSLVEPCRPPKGTGRNMVRLTEAGCEKIGLAWTDVPAYSEAQQPFARRCKPPRPMPAAKPEPQPFEPMLAIDRTPCSYCGVRADIGCAHLARAA